MVTGAEVLQFLIPNDEWTIVGDSYEGITFFGKTVTKSEFEAGFAQVETWKAEQAAAKAHERSALLTKLGITEEEARLLLGGK